MRERLLTLVALLIIASCGDRNSKKEETSTVQDTTTTSSFKQPDTTLPADLEFKIISENPNPTLEESVLNVELNRKATKQELSNLAYELRSTRKSGRLWISYTIQNRKVGSGPWATSHFTPGLKVEILGSTAEEEENQNKQASTVEGTVLGKWYEDQRTFATYVLYRKQNELMMKMISKDGSSKDGEVTIEKVSNADRINYKEDMQGKYFIVAKNGNLEVYNNENKKFATGTKTK